MTNPRQRIVDAAREWLGIVEESRNQFEGMERLWAATNYPDGWTRREPYCAAAVCRWVADGMPELKHKPRWASVGGWRIWARKPENGVLIIPRKEAAGRVMPGDIVSFLPNLSHIGLVEKLDGDTVHTIEANTSSDDAGDQRDGGGFHRKRRSLSFCGEFYRLPATATKA
jgi:hypothetical protein